MKTRKSSRQSLPSVAPDNTLSPALTTTSSTHTPASQPKHIPLEVLTHIASFLPHRDAISFALASRDCFTAALQKVWEELDLSLPPHWGEYPFVQVLSEADGELYEELMSQEAEAAEMRHRAGLRDKVKRITAQADARRLAGVRKVSLVPRRDSLYGVIHLLDLVSAGLETLEIRAKAPHAWKERYDSIESFQSLDVKLVDSCLSFPSLTHLTIHRGGIRQVETVHLLCRMAPNLLCLDVDVGARMERQHWDDDYLPNIPLLEKDTKIRQLRVSLRVMIASGEDDEDDDEDGPSHPMIDLIRGSPRLQQVSIQYHRSENRLCRPLLNALSKLPRLRDLYWPRSPQYFEKIPGSAPRFPALDRLVLSRTDHTSLFRFLPELPKLQVIYLVDSAGAKPIDTGTSNLPDPAPVPTMLPDFAKRLRNCPSLYIIDDATNMGLSSALSTFTFLDGAERFARPNGRVRSLRHGNSELLQVTFLTKLFERSDIPKPPDPAKAYTHTDEFTILPYTAKDGSSRCKAFGREAVSSRRCWTDWDGMAVPEEVITKMEGLQDNLKYWERGTEVGDEAWQVLLDWKKAQEEAGQGGVSGV